MPIRLSQPERSVPERAPFQLGSKIPKLAFLRAISAAIVVFFHSGYTAIPAGFGVLTFFVISGFLITHLLLKENEISDTISIRNFYARRALRILPAFYVYWILAVVSLTNPFHRMQIVWPEAISSLLYVANYYHGLHGHPSTLFSHTWSLGVEEQFYVLWPCVFVFFRRRLRVFATTLLFVIPAMWAYRACLYFAHVSEAYIYTSFETRFDAILVGCWFAIAIHTGFANRVIQEMRKSRYLPLTITLLAASIWANDLWGREYRDLGSFTVDPLLVATLILQLITLKGGAWMDGRIFSYLGKISYSTYLYQQLVLPVVHRVMPNSPHLLYSSIGLLCVWAVASASFEIVEKPFLRLKKKYSARSSAP